VLVTYREACILKPRPKDDYMVKVFWHPYGEIALFRGVSDILSQPMRPGQAIGRWQTCRDYVADRFIDRWIEGRRSGISVQKPGAGAVLRLVARGRHRIDDLRIRSISPEELPDVQKYLDAVANVPPEKRVGRVVVPGLKPGRSFKEVAIEFHRARE
jgi:hypothetical protein